MKNTHVSVGIFLFKVKNGYNGAMSATAFNDIGSLILYVASLITAGGVIVKFTLSRLQKIISDSLKTTNDRIDKLDSKIDKIDVDNSKNYLQQAISALDAGETMDSVAVQRFYEVYDHYTDDLHLNSWVHVEKERLEREGKLKRK